MMQLELSKPSVTLWVRSEIFHPSLLESEVLADDDETPGSGERQRPPGHRAARGAGG